MKWLRWLEDGLHYGQMAVVIAMAGLAFGLAYGWLVGVGVMVAAVAVLFGVELAIKALGRKAFETKVPQKRFPGPRK